MTTECPAVFPKEAAVVSQGGWGGTSRFDIDWWIITWEEPAIMTGMSTCGRI
jgi:hypothetical protein